MPKKLYAPVCSNEALIAAHTAIIEAETKEDLQQAVSYHGPRVGYKAFCYMLSGKSTAEQLIANKEGRSAEQGHPAPAETPQASPASQKELLMKKLAERRAAAAK